MTTTLSTLQAGVLRQVSIYPVKSLSGIALEQVLVEKEGPQDDRRFMIVDRHGEFLTQRDCEKLATVETRLENGVLWVGSEKVSWSDSDELLIPVRVWDSRFSALKCTGGVSEYLSGVVGKEVNLVRMTEKSKRRVNPLFGQENDFVSFADGYPLLIANEASLDDLNSRLTEKIGIERFRPNVSVSGFNAFEEDRWKRIRIGSSVFRVSKPCARCVVLTIDQKKGIRTGKEPLKTLAAFRRADQVYPENYVKFGFSKNDVLFGTNLIPETVGGIVKIGDEVEVLETSS